MNPTLVKQLDSRVCAVGLPLWRPMLTVVTAATAGAGSSTASQVSLSPAQIKQAVAEFAAKDASYKPFLELRKTETCPGS